MSKTAVFVGGPLDMTKRAVVDGLRNIYFFEPVNPALGFTEAPEEAVVCKQIRYEFENITRGGVLIYSYAGTESQ